MLKGNCLVAQSGGPTAVINSSACGVIQEAFKENRIEKVLAADNGILGILKEEIFDLSKESAEIIAGLRHTPSSALGTCRYKLSPQEYEKVLEVFKKYNIRFFFYIGGNDSQDTANQVEQLATQDGYDMRVIGIPKTVDNDLYGTDHCPGFGSVLKLTAAMVREVGLDTEASYSTDKVNIIETMGRNAGWIAGGTALAKEAPGQAPDIILLPEVAFDKSKFLSKVDDTLTKQKRCVVVVSEGIQWSDGSYVAEGEGKLSVDSFGHRQLGGTSIILKNIIEQELQVKSRYCRPSILNRNGIHFASATDAQEAYDLGVHAVRLAIEDQSGVMVTLIRDSDSPYHCHIETVPLSEVANREKTFPLDWIESDGMSIKLESFIPYARPLIQGELKVPIKDGLPAVVRLKKEYITF